MRIDTHIHTKRFSCDSDLNIDEVLKNLKEDELICLTEHAEHEDYLEEGTFIFDKEIYFKEFAPLREKNVLLGVELGLNFDRQADILAFYDERFDYILGSTHTLYGKDIFYKEGVYEKTKLEVYDDYFNQTINLLKEYKFCNAVAHFDYITRYAPYSDPYIRVSEQKDKLIELFTCLKDTDTLLELNTKADTDMLELEKILNLYKECGNDYLVIGSDSHIETTVFNKYEIYLELIARVGLKQAYFKNQQMYINE